jgi:hypothetical protein
MLRCVTCGYDLTGMTIGGACPECGQAIEHTIRRLMATPGLPISSWAIASLIFGVLGMCLPPLGVLAILFYLPVSTHVRVGIAHPSSKGLATAGLILGIIAIVLTVVLLVA